MDLLALVDQVRTVLQTKRRVSYRMLKRQFGLDDETLDDLKYELIEVDEVATDKDGKMLVWTGGELPQETPSPTTPPISSAPSGTPVSSQPEASLADRRQLTVMFCDLVGSTPMSAQLDPEDYRDIMQAYQEMCGHVLARFTGHIARYEGDGILVYFGYPQAQEDAAVQAVRAGLQIIVGLPDLNARFQPRFPLLQERPLQVRIGLHTGLVVVGEMGSEQYRIDIAVGETPNMAARIQGQAGPNEVVISTATYQLVEGLFECEDRGPQELKGIAAPQSVYRVKGEGQAQSRFEVALQRGLTPLVGRTEEVDLLHRRWERAQAGTGQVVLLSGEPGIGKSRLVQELKTHTATQSPVSVECRCSPNAQNSALAPIIEHLHRLLRFERNESPEAKVQKLEQMLTMYDFSLPDTVPLLASLLSLAVPESYPSLQLSSQKQKDKTLELLVMWLRKDAERQPLRVIFEDLHWADPSTLEFLTLLVDQIATMQALLVLTFRPEFTPPWPSRPYMLSLTLDRLPEAQITELAQYVAGKALPPAVLQQLVAKTDGVPLFAEELTKTLVESGHLHETDERYELASPLQAVTIPTTLHDSLRARLDRLNTAQEIAQIGATIGREFSYELLHAVSPLEEEPLQQGLRQLLVTDLISQKGLPPQAQYVFKHALVQDSAYQSLLRSTRQGYHQKIAQVLEEQFSDTKDTQPELLAYHYTEAGLGEQAIPYWRQAGQRASQRSAHVEAVRHLTTGLKLLKALPDTPAYAEVELTLQIALGAPLMATKGWAAPEVEQAYARARELCQQAGETPQLFPALRGLWSFYAVRAEFQTAREFGQELLRIAQRACNPILLLEAHLTLGATFLWLGEFAAAREHLEKGVSLYDPQQLRSHISIYGLDPAMICLSYAAYAHWYLGYPEQALKSSRAAVASAQELALPFGVAYALDHAAELHQYRREEHTVQEQTSGVIALSTEHGYPLYAARGHMLRGWVLAEKGQTAEGITQIRQGLDDYRATGQRSLQAYFLALLAEAHGRGGQAEEGLTVLAEALDIVHQTGERLHESELYRLKGELLLQHSSADYLEAEASFQQALAVAHQQHAKSWELRAAISLAQLWQQQGKTAEARELLAPVYNWFTEGFDTQDLKDAKALLEALA